MTMLATSSLLCLSPSGCEDRPRETATDPATPPASAAAPAGSEVGYDVRRLRPRNEETLAAMFERMRKAAVDEGKTVAVLFSAGWCEPCQRLDLEFGQRHPEQSIGHVRIFELKEEDWEAVTRMDEFNELRRKWSGSVNDYPLFVVLDEQGNKREEMKDAIARLEREQLEANLPNWFRGLRNG